MHQHNLFTSNFDTKSCSDTPSKSCEKAAEQDWQALEKTSKHSLSREQKIKKFKLISLLKLLRSKVGFENRILYNPDSNTVLSRSRTETTSDFSHFKQGKLQEQKRWGKRKNNKFNNGQVRSTISTGIWYLCFLVLFDIFINLLFPYPSNPKKNSPGTLNRYFEYGRSIEGKISRMVGSPEQSSSSLAQAGWLRGKTWAEQPVRPESGSDLLIATYGMSFSNRVSRAIEKIDLSITLRLIAGPAAPPNHSFAAYTLERGQHQADVVIWGILASSVKGLSSMNSATWQFEAPAPFTFPKYIIKDGQLEATWPHIQTLSELYLAMENKQQWKKFTAQLREHDRYFNSFLFHQNLLDYSAIVRLIRRAWAQKHQENIVNKIYSSDGFNLKSEEIKALQLMVTTFATTAKADEKLPIVLLLNDQGYDNHLFQALKPTLEADSIPFVSTHNIASATDIRNFISDGHFTKAADKLIAEEVLNLINLHLDRSSSSFSAKN